MPSLYAPDAPLQQAGRLNPEVGGPVGTYFREPGSRKVAVSQWLPWAVLPALVLLAFVAHAGHLLTLLFPPVAVLLGLYFLRVSPDSYVRLVIVLYATSAFCRRIADYTSSFSESNPIVLAPYLVAGLAILTVFRPVSVRRSIPLLLAALGLCYGLLVGILKVHDPSFAKSLIRWTVPLLFGMFCTQYKNKKQLLDVVLTTTLWCAVAGAVYGLVQYLVVPPWDGFWLTRMREVGMGGGFGDPAPFEIRVFGLMNSPAFCANFCVAGLLCALRLKERMRYVVMLVLVSTLVLTMVRIAWIGAALLLPLLILKLPRRERFRMLTVVPLVVFGVGAIALPVMTAAGSSVAQRLTSMGSMKEDDSYQVRHEGIRRAMSIFMDEPEGKGVGFMESASFMRSPMANVSPSIGPHDVGAFEVLLELGLCGTALYAAGMIFATFNMVKHLLSEDFSAAMIAGLGLYAWLLLPSGNPLIAYEGLLFWVANGILLDPSASGIAHGLYPAPAISAPLESEQL